MLKDKVLVVIVTRNNPILLSYQFDMIKKYNPGYDCDFLIVDNSSDNKEHLLLLEKLKNNAIIMSAPNGRAESSFNFAWQNNRNYKYYFLMHDDCIPNNDDWLKIFVDRINSNFIENIAKEYVDLPIGRVGAMHQPWRSYTSILGYSVQCIFLQHALKVLHNEAPTMFKYCDGDRVFFTRECLEATNGLKSLTYFENMKKENSELFDELCSILHKHLPYPDEGLPPYPAGECWNKLTLLIEFLNNVEPLINGYRVVGLGGEGYLEQIHGYDQPYGNKHIIHYGQPSVKEFLANKFNVDAKEINKHLKNKVFLMKCGKIIKDYYKDKK